MRRRIFQSDVHTKETVITAVVKVGNFNSNSNTCFWRYYMKIYAFFEWTLAKDFKILSNDQKIPIYSLSLVSDYNKKV